MASAKYDANSNPESGDPNRANLRESVDVVWADGTMVPHTVENGIYTYRAGQVATTSDLGDAQRNELNLRPQPKVLRLVGEEIGYVYEPSSTIGAARYNSGPIAPMIIDEKFGDSPIKASVHHVCGLTPYYMISEADPVRAEEGDFETYSAAVNEKIGQVLPEPNIRSPRPTVALIDTGYVMGLGDDAEATLTVAHGLVETDFPESKLPSEDVRLDAEELLARATGHGKFVASVFGSVARHSTLVFERAKSALDGVVDEYTVCQQMIDAAEKGADIINLSLGCYGKDDEPPLLLLTTIKKILDHLPDLVIVAAAGNNSSERKFWPAAFATAESLTAAERARIVSVGALGPDGRAHFTNRGPSIEWYAPGENVVGQYIGSEGAPAIRKNVTKSGDEGFTGHATWEGASFAAPYVAGLIARTMQINGQTAREAWEHLQELEPEERRAISLLRADEV